MTESMSARALPPGALSDVAAPPWSFRLGGDATPDENPDPGALRGQGATRPLTERREQGAGARQAPSAVPRRSSFGPAGKHRAPASVVALSAVTLGLYGLIWHHRVNREIGDFDPRLRVRPGRSTWAVSIAWLLGLAGTASGAGILIVGHVRPSMVTGVPSQIGWALLPALLAVPYIVLLLPFGAVAVGMTLERTRVVQEHVGIPGDIQLEPARELCWLLLPLIGGAVHMARQQRALDDIWDWIDAGPNRRRSRP